MNLTAMHAVQNFIIIVFELAQDQSTPDDSLLEGELRSAMCWCAATRSLCSCE